MVTQPPSASMTETCVVSFTGAPWLSRTTSAFRPARISAASSAA